MNNGFYLDSKHHTLFDEELDLEYQNRTNDVLRIISWNVNSWSVNNCKVREHVLDYGKPDVAIIVETKLKNNDTITMPGYKWLGSNRKSELKTARCVSGGISFFLKYDLLNDWLVEDIDKNIEGL